MKYHIKRIYDEANSNDGYRVLVDRLWPRGVSKQKAALDEWCKAIAPSDELRKWFNHDPAKFQEFATRYDVELSNNPEVKVFEQHVKNVATVTLLYSAHDEAHNQAVVLQAYLSK